jgi:hypothetical protein
VIADAVRERIAQCDDEARLQRWLEHAGVVAAAEDLMRELMTW